MPAPTYNITIEQGADWTRDLFLTTATQGTIDVSGRTFKAEIRQYPSGTVATAINCSVISAAGGQVRMSVTSAASLLVPTAGAKWDMFMNNAGTVTKLLTGDVTLKPRITVL